MFVYLRKKKKVLAVSYSVSNKTSLLVKGIGSDTDTNNTFIDTSPNNFTVTRNGNVSQGSFSPFSPAGWSGLFGTTSDNLVVAAGVNFAYGLNPFTVEMWVNPTANNGFIYAQTISGTNYFLISTGASGELGFAATPSGHVQIASSPANSVPLNVWSHIAVVRVGTGTNQTLLFVNGVQVASGTCSMDFSNTTYNPTIASYTHTLANRYYGQISNLRIVKGIAVYTSNFTPSPTPLTAIEGTSLLCLQDNRFKDNSVNNFILTTTGTPKIVPSSPFGSGGYNSSIHGGSLYFDGTGDYLSVPNHANLQLSNSDFTIECWTYITSYNSPYSAIGGQGAATNAAANWDIVIPTSGIVWFEVYYGGTKVQITSGTKVLPLNSWCHVACVRAGNVFKLYLNGVSVGTSTNAITLNSNVLATQIGSQNSGQNFPGYISDFRIIKGTALYLSDFNVPSAPLTTITNTQLFLRGTNAKIIDKSCRNTIETVSTAKISTSVLKYCSTSMYFNGSSDYLSIPNTNNENNFNTGDFTIEAWIYPIALSTMGQIIGIHNYGTSCDWVLALNTNGTIYFQLNTTPNTSIASVIINAWSHIAVCRLNGIVTFYINGAVSNSVTMAMSDIRSSMNLTIGSSRNGAWFYKGYISDLRISKYAVYYTYFTPPELEISNNTDVNDPYFNRNILVLQGNGTNNSNNNTFIDTSSNNFTITRTGNVSQGSFSPFYSNWSVNLYSSSYLATPANAAFDITGGNFTVECWVNFNSYNTMGGSGNVLITNFVSSGGWGFGIDGINTISSMSCTYYTGGTPTSVYSSSLSPADIPLGTWNHVALVKNGSTLTFYLNGVSRGSVTSPATAGAGAQLVIGVYQQNMSYSGRPNWLLSNLRVVKGTAVYTSNFTVPTSKLIAIANTSLLALQDSRIKDNSGNNFTLTVTNGSAIVSKLSPFQVTTAYTPATNGGSGYFDGTGDYLSTTLTNGLPATANFTVEAWVYPTSFSTQYGRGIITFSGSSYTPRFFLRHGINSGTLNIYYYDGSGFPFGSAGTTSSLSCALNTWNHVALVRNNGVFTVYLNGVSAITSNQPALSLLAMTTVRIGTNFDGSSPEYSGYISNVRFVSGTAVYTSNFTPPTSPVTAIANTQLLCNFSNAGIYDSSSSLNVETMGTAKISTSNFKNGASSIYLDGTSGCYLRLSQNINFASSDFTIDFWYYKTVQAGAHARLFQTADGDVITAMYLTDESGTLKYFASTDGVAWQINGLSGGTLSLNTWYHIVLRRVGSIFNLYVNGVVAGTSTLSGSLYYSATQIPIIGGQGPSPYRTITGYIDDFRITLGKGRYTVEPTSELVL